MYMNEHQHIDHAVSTRRFAGTLLKARQRSGQTGNDADVVTGWNGREGNCTCECAVQCAREMCGHAPFVHVTRAGEDHACQDGVCEVYGP